MYAHRPDHACIEEPSDLDLVNECAQCLQALNKKIQPMLYYPQNQKEQNAIMKSRRCRHAYYIDWHTKEMYYINLRGTARIAHTDLISKEIEEMHVDAKQWMIHYFKPNHRNASSFMNIEHSFDSVLGHGFQMTNDKMKAILADAFVSDSSIQLAETLVFKIKSDHARFRSYLSLFPKEAPLSVQQMRALLEISKQILVVDTPAVDVRLYQKRPTISSFKGKGDSCYVFVDDAHDPMQSGCWYVDRSHNRPKLVKYPLDWNQMDRIRYLFSGAQQLEPPNPKYASYERYLKWYGLGQFAEKKTTHTDFVSVTLRPEDAKLLPSLWVSDLKIGENVIDDWSYCEAHDRLSNSLETATTVKQNAHMIERCRIIQSLLNTIGEDLYQVFPNTRGIVPHEQRVKLLSMIDAIISNPQSEKAQHYLRTRHRVYCDQDGFIDRDHCEPSSFLWIDNELIYLDEHRDQHPVLMTEEIKQTITHLVESPERPAYLSTDEVYDLMTHPMLFQYVYGLPVALNCKYLDFNYFIPMGFDPSKSLRTGTAQEMMRELHDRHLSIASILYRIGKHILVGGVSLVFHLFFLKIIVAWLALTLIENMILNWVGLVMTVSMSFSILKSFVMKNELMQPDFNALDVQLRELGECIDAISENRVSSMDVSEIDHNPPFNGSNIA